MYMVGALAWPDGFESFGIPDDDRAKFQLNNLQGENKICIIIFNIYRMNSRQCNNVKRYKFLEKRLISC